MLKPVIISGFLKSVKDVLFPEECGICHRHTGDGICTDCDEALDTALLSDPIFTVNVNGKKLRCAACFVYNDRDAVETLVFELKRNSSERLVGYCAGRMCFAVQCLGITGKAIFTGVPRSVSGMRKNGFDQAQLLARKAAKLSQNGEYLKLLKRHGFSKEQKKLSADGRKQNIKGKFRICTFCGMSPEYDGSIVIFDDVCTTGASVAECAEMIGRAFPFAKVYAVFLALTEGERH